MSAILPASNESPRVSRSVFIVTQTFVWLTADGISVNVTFAPSSHVTTPTRPQPEPSSTHFLLHQKPAGKVKPFSRYLARRNAPSHSFSPVFLVTSMSA